MRIEEKNIIIKSKNAIVGIAGRAGKYLKKSNVPRAKKIAGMALIPLAVLALWIILLQYFTADKYGTVVRIGNETAAAAAVDADTIDYGTLAKGGSAAGFITVENRGSRKMYVKTVAIGSISHILKIDKNDFTLFPQERASIRLLVEIPGNADKTQYKGRVIVFKIPAIF